MIQSRKFVAAAILTGLALIAAGLLIAPFNASARAAVTVGEDVAMDRIGGAFAMIQADQTDPAIAADAAPASKGDFGLDPACAGAAWPNIDASCLTGANGSKVQPVRMITIGYQSDDTTTVLVRYPEVAAR
jgi:hypothetical protein